MEAKRYAEVLIDGRIYTLGGYEDEAYMQRVASYINEMITTLKRQQGFTRQNADYQQVMIELNMADDYFKARDQIAHLEKQKREMEKEIYSIKHELVNSQMKLESAMRELEAWRSSARMNGAADKETAAERETAAAKAERPETAAEGKASGQQAVSSEAAVTPGQESLSGQQARPSERKQTAKGRK